MRFKFLIKCYGLLKCLNVVSFAKMDGYSKNGFKNNQTGHLKRLNGMSSAKMDGYNKNV